MSLSHNFCILQNSHTFLTHNVLSRAKIPLRRLSTKLPRRVGHREVSGF